MGWNCGSLWSGGTGGGNWLFPVLHIATSLLFWGALIAGGFYLVKALSNNRASSNSNTNTSALEILKLRYAKGEISKEDYERIKKDL
ncbi:MAG TPA: SHOCT domain-containing protein [Bacillota bacterium]|nr:SHOCT domain-containing protein [Bacillota bacterium]